MRSLWLAIDATSPRSSAALAEGGRLLAETSSPAGDGRRSRGGSLLELVDACFRAARRDVGELEAVVAVTGPGSFTGVRVTLATAMGLVPHGGSGARLLGISSLAALALQAPPVAASVFCLVDALRGEWFRQRFVRADGGLRPAGEAERGAPEPPEGAVTLLQPGGGGAASAAPGGALAAAPLAGPVAVAASAGAAAALLAASPAPLYLRAPAVTPPRPPAG